MIDQRPICWRG